MRDKNVEVVLDDNVAGSARKLLMQEAEKMWASGVVDANSEYPIVGTVNTASTGESVRLTMASLLGMGELHVAAERLQLFRSSVCCVLRVKSVAVKYNNRVPAFCGDSESTLDELATDVMQVLLRSNPSVTVWRSDARPKDDAGEDLQLSANVFVGNMGAAWMTDQLRWRESNHPAAVGAEEQAPVVRATGVALRAAACSREKPQARRRRRSSHWRRRR
eukprot:TRINITY_DN4011_c0_g1_i1.p2 TRINITY_DN4011_c0_g1~~TRINITY_DN4011_c0_g1_i1.p2  ORF type:complete len:219 (-),score=46.48 TRINITY_DN4011_c0_g1_i1:475-1131(-)